MASNMILTNSGTYYYSHICYLLLNTILNVMKALYHQLCSHQNTFNYSLSAFGYNNYTDTFDLGVN